MKTKNIPYAKYNNIYQIAAGLAGDKNILLSPPVAIDSALTGILSTKYEGRKRELLGDEVYSRAQELLKIRTVRETARTLRKKYFPPTKDFEERHFFSNPTAGLTRMLVEEYHRRFTDLNFQF